MRRASAVLFALLASSCGSTAVDTPSGPSAPTAPVRATTPSFPDVVGMWAGTAEVTIVDRARGTSALYGCAESWNITSQDGGEFSGSWMSNGQSSSSDPYCTQSGTFTSAMTPDATLLHLRLTPSFDARACTRRSAEGNFTGIINTTAFLAQMTDQWTCTDSTGRPYDAHRTVALTLTRR